MPSLDLEKNALASAAPWLLGIYLDSDNLASLNDGEGGTVDYRHMVADTEKLTWDGVDFQIFPFSFSSISLTSSGKLPSINLNLFNTATVAEIVEGNNGFLGCKTIVYFLNKNVLNTYTRENYPLKFEFKVTDCKIGNIISLQLGSDNFLAYNIPSKRFYRDFCDVEFGKDFCWMKDFNPSGKSCNKGFEDCRQHWINEGKPTMGIRFPGFPMLNKGTIHYY